MLFTKSRDSLTLCVWNIFIESSMLSIFCMDSFFSQCRHNFFWDMPISNTFDLWLSMYLRRENKNWKIYQGFKSTDTAGMDKSNYKQLKFWHWTRLLLKFIYVNLRAIKVTIIRMKIIEADLRKNSLTITCKANLCLSLTLGHLFSPQHHVVNILQTFSDAAQFHRQYWRHKQITKNLGGPLSPNIKLTSLWLMGNFFFYKFHFFIHRIYSNIIFSLHWV